MKKIIILSFCLLCYIVEAQQQKPETKKDSSFIETMAKLNTLQKKVNQVNKKATKKVAEFNQRDDLQIIPERDTVLIGLDRSDSLEIYYSIKDSIDAQLKRNKPEKAGTGVGNFIRSLQTKKKKSHDKK